MEEVTLLGNKNSTFPNMYRVNTGFHVTIEGSFLKISNILGVRGSMVQNKWNEQTMRLLTYNTKSSKAYKLVTDKVCGINIIVKHSSLLHLNQNEYCMFPSVVQ